MSFDDAGVGTQAPALGVQTIGRSGRLRGNSRRQARREFPRSLLALLHGDHAIFEGQFSLLEYLYFELFFRR